MLKVILNAFERVIDLTSYPELIFCSMIYRKKKKKMQRRRRLRIGHSLARRSLEARIETYRRMLRQHREDRLSLMQGKNTNKRDYKRFFKQRRIKMNFTRLHNRWKRWRQSQVSRKSDRNLSYRKTRQ